MRLVFTKVRLLRYFDPLHLFDRSLHSEYAIPKLYIKIAYCVSCAIHSHGVFYSKSFTKTSFNFSELQSSVCVRVRVVATVPPLPVSDGRMERRSTLPLLLLRTQRLPLLPRHNFLFLSISNSICFSAHTVSFLASISLFD